VAEEETREYYRQRAAEYEQIYFREVPERRKEIDDEAAFVRDLAYDCEVLDLACGTGYWTQIMAETAASIVALDLSWEMIAQAGQKIYRRQPHFVQGELERLPFVDRGFDLVTLGFWFSHQPKQEYEPFFDRIVRLVRSGGRIWLIDNNPPAEGPTVDSAYVDEHGNNFKRRYLDTGEAFVILKNYFSRADLESIFGDLFRIERLVHEHYYWSILLSIK